MTAYFQYQAYRRIVYHAETVSHGRARHIEEVANHHRWRRKSRKQKQCQNEQSKKKKKVIPDNNHNNKSAQRYWYGYNDSAYVSTHNEEN